MKPRASDQELALAVSMSTNPTQVLRTLGLCPTGGSNRRAVVDRIRAIGIDTSHFHGTPTKGSVKSSLLTQSAKRRLFREGVLRDECYECGLNPTWNGKHLTLHVDHINGDGRDHRVENLRVLCPNCHTQTPTYAGRNRKQIPPISQPNNCGCGRPISPASRRCTYCWGREQERAAWPTDTDLRHLVWALPVREVARQLGVTDVAVKKRCAKRGIATPPRGYWQRLRSLPDVYPT